MQNKVVFFIFTLIFAFVAGTTGGLFADYLQLNKETAPIINALPGIPEETKQKTTQKKDTNQAEEESTATQKVAEDSHPSVVSIIITQELEKRRQSSGENPFTGNPFFDQFLPDNSSAEGSTNNNSTESDESPTAPETEKVEVGEGSGFVISEDGLILTNRHVVGFDDASYTVVFDDGKSFEATVLDRDELNDLAILKIEADNLTPLPLGDSDKLQAGETVIAIGNTLGAYTNTVTRGIISGLSRNLDAEYTGLIQTDAAINQGNSGGPLLNLQGEVIGMNTAVDRGGEGIGFAIPINEAKTAIESVKESGRIIRPALGVRYVPITAEIAKANNLAYEYGAYIRGDGNTQFGVIPGSSADKAGIEEGDIILEIDGVKVNEEHSLSSLIKSHEIGDEIEVKIFQNGEEKEVTVTLEELPDTTTAAEESSTKAEQ